MDGEIDLESYTLSMIRLNTVFQKIEDNNIGSDLVSDIDDCVSDLSDLHEDILNDLSLDEVNFNEYDPFFENAMDVFPTYIRTIEEVIEKTDDDNVKGSLDDLSGVFVKLIETGNDYFKNRGFVK